VALVIIGVSLVRLPLRDPYRAAPQAASVRRRLGGCGGTIAREAAGVSIMRREKYLITSFTSHCSGRTQKIQNIACRCLQRLEAFSSSLSLGKQALSGALLG